MIAAGIVLMEMPMSAICAALVHLSAPACCCRLVEQCNLLDEVWVPSNHHVGIFAKAGVQKSKLVVMPESIDTDYFDPDTVQPLSLPRYGPSDCQLL